MIDGDQNSSTISSDTGNSAEAIDDERNYFLNNGLDENVSSDNNDEIGNE